MAKFNILEHLDALEPDGGTNIPRGDHSFLCPLCGSSNFKIHIKTGRWNTFGCDCASTELGKRRIRHALSPANAPDKGQPQLKPTRRAKQQRSWTYYSLSGEPLLKVNRTDDGNGKRTLWQESLIKGKKPVDLSDDCRPYGYWEAKEDLKRGAAYVFWVEGEPCVDALRKLGLPAVTCLGGSKFDSDRDANLFPPEKVVVVPDRDLVGVKHADAVANAYPGCQWLYCYPDTPEWNGSCPASKGRDIADWIDDGATVDDLLNGIGERLKPAEKVVDINDPRLEFLRDAQSLKDRLDHGLQQIDALPDIAARSVALHTLQQDLGLNDKKFTALVRVLAEAKEQKAPESFEELMAADEANLEPIVDDLLTTGLVLIAAEGHAGKTTLAYLIAEAVSNGSKFAGQFECKQAPVLIIQCDESNHDARRKFKLLGLQPAKGRLQIKWQFNPMMLPELRQWIKESSAKLVILDSLVTIAGGTISPKDAEFGLLIYRLNQLAAELGVCFMCVHHLTKEKGRTEVTKDDIYGTAYVFNGASDAWGLWQTREDGNPERVYNLASLKARSGLVELGTTYEFDGNEEDQRLIYRGIKGRVISLDQIKTSKGRVRALIQKAGGAALDPKAVNAQLDLGNVNYAGRLCRELFTDPREQVDRKPMGTTAKGGRPIYGYFWISLEYKKTG